MCNFKTIIKNSNVSNISANNLLKAVCEFYPVFDYVQEVDKETFWKAMRNFHEHIVGKHFDEMYAIYQVSEMFHKKPNGTICKGEIYNKDIAKSTYDMYIRHINPEYTCWDVYVAINAQYHDYYNMYKEWYPNISKEELDEKIILSAIIFWFKDEDAKIGKIWDYFKEH